MKSLLIVGLIFNCFFAYGKSGLNINQLESLRRRVVLGRWAADNPGQVKCNFELDLAKAGANLSLAVDNAKAEWSQLELSTVDLDWLKSRIKVCELRGSCQLYFDLITSARIGSGLEIELNALKSSLENKLTRMSVVDYQKASRAINGPCELLKKLQRDRP